MKKYGLSLTLSLAFVLGLFRMPYGYYMLSRLVFATAMAVIAYMLFKRSNATWVAAVSLVVLYNPIIPIHLGSKALWTIVNIMTITFVYRSESRLESGGGISTFKRW